MPHVYPAGGVLAYGDAPSLGVSSLASLSLSAPVTSIAALPNGEGYWIAGADGAVYAFGAAGFHGSFGSESIPQYSPVIAIVSTSDGGGYWLASQTGGVFTFGDAGFFGSLGGIILQQPIVAMMATGTGEGYWLIAADGGVFTFGDAGFYGSAYDLPFPLQAPISAAAATTDGLGYWLVGQDGSVFTFGDAGFFGSAAPFASELANWNAPVLGFASTHDGKGYWLAAANGSVYPFGSATTSGDENGADPSFPVSAIATTSDDMGYWLLEPDGFQYSFTNPSAGGEPQASAIVSTAESQVAPNENSSWECNPYGPCEYWCSLFTDWVWQQVGVPIPSNPLARSVYQWAAANSSLLPASATPLVGDVAMYGDGPPPALTYHVGIVVQVWPSGALVTIEGDSGPNLDGHYSVVMNGPFLPDHAWASGNYAVYGYAQP